MMTSARHAVRMATPVHPSLGGVAPAARILSEQSPTLETERLRELCRHECTKVLEAPAT